MSDTSPNLGLPFLLASQAQKHVTLNEGLQAIDNLLMLAIKSRSISNPPSTPIDGDRYIIGNNPTGDWAGKSGQIAAYNNLGWAIYPPKSGFLGYIIDEALFKHFDGIIWKDLPIAPVAFQNLSRLGIGTEADNDNQLAAKLNNALFSASYTIDGGNGDVRLKLNKESTSKTASFIFQNNWSGRAEFGLLGDDNFGIKVSSDGASWNTVLSISPQTGALCKPINLSENNDFANLNSLGMVMLRISAKNGEQARLLMDTFGNAVANYCGRATAGTAINPTATALGQRLVQLSGFGYGTSGPIAGSAGYVAIETTENWTDSNRGSRIVFGTTANGTSATQLRLVIENDGSLLPNIDNSIALGSANNRFSTVYCATGTINTSDARDKIEQSEIDGQIAIELVSKINPKIFKWKVGKRAADLETFEKQDNDDTTQPKIIDITGTRNHAGFFAQDVKAALDAAELDLAVWGFEDKNNPNSKQWLRPDQMLPILWAAVKELQARIDSLEAKILEL